MMKNMPTYEVSIIPQETYDEEEIKSKVGNFFDDMHFDFKNKSVLLKPSFVFPISDQERTIGVNTHINVVAGVARCLSERGASEILIAENRTIGTGRYAFSMLKIKKVTKNIDNVKYFYLDEEPTEEIILENPFIPNHIINYPKILLNGNIDYFISLPKLKGNNYADVTLSVKNNFGLISKKERLRYHADHLHQHLADLMLIRKPDIIIADAIVAGEGNGPAETDPINTGMLIAGNNPLAVDTTSCYLIGQNPKEIEHLSLLNRRNVGPIDINEIDITNREYLETKKLDFVKPDLNLNVYPTLNIYKGTTCKSGCQPFLRSILDSYGRSLGWKIFDNFTIITGENVKITDDQLKKLKKKRTIVYGDCAKEFSEYGAFFQGCPPDYVKAMIYLPYKTDLPKNPYLNYTNYGKYLWFLMIDPFIKVFKKIKQKITR
ncbi:MAG: DUF362 domain-containing protein [Candidatus Lokiarchaeota archaeon]|nr:DUF362 domain-containing protein [Candidatus Lokiarchaeota archaeon]MBD3200812.1 DUF362 domain-containing protein [Candidatus Lokiarchaeota archaeon]